MLKKIISFEIVTRIKTPVFYLCLILMMCQALIITKGVYDYYVNEVVLMNSSSILFKNFAGGGMLYIIVIAIITGSVLYRDIEYKTAETLYTFPINDKKFFIGKFLAAFIINILVTSGFVIGMFLLPYSGIAKPEAFGNPPLLQILQGYFLLLLPNIFILTASCFIPLVFTKKITSSYLGITAVTLLFILLEGVSATIKDSTLLQIVEPFTYVYVLEVLKEVPIALKNTTFLPLTATYFINKALWLSMAFIGLGLAYKRFSFAYFIEKTSKKTKESINAQTSEVKEKNIPTTLPKVSVAYSTIANIKRLFRLAKLEFIDMVRPKGFRIVFGIVVLIFFLQNLLYNASYYIGPEQPFTTNMTLNRLVLGVFIIILLLVWTGELLFKEKISNLWQLTDTLPIPVWVRLFSKYIAMSGVALCLSIAIITAGIITQLIQGYTNFEISLYIEDVLGYKWGWLGYMMLLSLPFFIASITSHRFLTHIISVGIFLFTIIAFDLGVIEDHRYGILSGIPGLEDYSEISGYGIFSISSFWFACLWSTLTLFFLFASVYFWQRGVKNDWRKKLSFKGEQLNWASKIIALGAVVLFFVLQSFISKNMEGNFKTLSQQDAEKAKYENKYKRIESYAQPIITHIKANIALYPIERKIKYTTTLKLKNFSNSTIDSLYINLSEFSTITEARISNQAITSAWQDVAQQIYAYKLPNSLEPLETLDFQLKVTKQHQGFSTVDSQEGLVFNGTVLTRDILPILGYNSDKELNENKKRIAHDLDKIPSKMADYTNTDALSENYFSTDAHHISTDLTISTSINQQIVASGTTVKRWQKENRNYVQMKLTNRPNFLTQITSAELVQKKADINGVSVKLWHKESHTFNTDTYLKAVKYGINFINTHLGAYPYKELNIAEINNYSEAFYSSPNLLLISEKEGWRADTSLEKEESYIYFSVLTQLIKQRLTAVNEIANIQGAEMLLRALPQAIALQAVQEKYSTELVATYLDTKKSSYEKARNNEANTEPALIHADDSDYLEANKGVVALFTLSKTVGFKKFNKEVTNYFNNNIDKPIVFNNLYKELMKSVTDAKKEGLKNTFERVE